MVNEANKNSRYTISLPSSFKHIGGIMILIFCTRVQFGPTSYYLLSRHVALRSLMRPNIALLAFHSIQIYLNLEDD